MLSAVSRTYRFGRFELIPATRQLLADGGAVTLGARAFDVLLALIERRERLVSKDELLKLAWPGLVVEEGNLQVQISALRKILGPQAIATISGKGYRFSMRLKDDPPPAVERPTDAPERRKEPRPWLVPSQSEGPRLAAVVFTDVVGYSARMQKDEAGTIALVKADFERMRVLCGKHGGEALNTMGDGLLLCFPSALQAVSCALQIQREFGARKQSNPNSLEHRIGVHLGDVFHLDTGDVAGDGINIASRLESKALPGGICLSQTVYDTVKGKLPMRSTFLGPVDFKNIVEPVPIWQVTPEEVAGPAKIEAQPEAVKSPASADAPKTSPAPSPARSATRGKSWSAVAAVVLAALGVSVGWYFTRPQAPVDKSIAVLPFANMSEDKNMAYFADGVHEDLLTQLALLGDLKVVSRTSVMEYRDTRKNARQIAAELGVASLLEGSVRRSANQVRVSAQLIDASSDKHLWAKSYDRELQDIFAIQSELAIEIARALKVTLNPRAETQITARPTSSLDAYDTFLRAQELFNQSQGTIREWASLKDRIALLSKAVELDPRFAHAWARLAVEHARAYYSATDKTPARQTQAKSAMDQALALAPEDLLVRIAEGDYYRMALADYERAAQAYDKVLRAAPHNVDALNGLASVYLFQDRAAERLALIERALTVEPRSFGALARLKFHYLIYRHYDRALAYQQKLIDLRSDDIPLQAEYHRIEYYRTGTWDAYDTWRSRLPERAEGKYLVVRDMDLDRAIARRDYSEVLRLAEVDPEDARDSLDSSQAGILKHRLLALTHRARGDHVRAIESARMGMRLLKAETKSRPRDWYSWQLLSWLHAVLGERDAALATHEQAVAVAKKESGAVVEEQSRRGLLGLYALLGNRTEAVAEASRQLKLPDSNPNEMRVSLELADLWDDSRFQAILNDPSNISPLPFNTKYSQVQLR